MTTILSDRFSYSVIVCLSILVGSLAVSCGETKYVQCEQIIQIANNVVNEKTKLIDSSDLDTIESKTWLKEARSIAQAAKKLEQIKLKDPKLIEYQSDLAQVYRIYSQATYDAVKAWENKNIQALQLAHTHAQKAGQLEAKLGQVINNYCGSVRK